MFKIKKRPKSPRRTNRRGARLNVPLYEQRRAKMQVPPSQQDYFDRAPIDLLGEQQYGGYSGCAYRGGDSGVVCMRNMNRYIPDSNFWTSNWRSNVDVKFPAPVVATGNGALQMLQGGGTEYSDNTCTQACACTAANPSCECAANDNNCGWVSVNHECVGAVPDGTYGSLAQCEEAQNYGFYWLDDKT